MLRMFLNVITKNNKTAKSTWIITGSSLFVETIFKKELKISKMYDIILILVYIRYKSILY